MGSLLPLALLLVTLDGLVDVDIEALDLLGQALAFLLQLSNLILHVVLALLSHEGLAHTISDGAFIKSLVGLNRHLYLVTDTYQQETTFGALNGDLADQLVEALSVEFLTDGAYAGLAGLACLQTLVQLILEVDNVHSSCRCRGHITDPQLPILCVLTRGQD